MPKFLLKYGFCSIDEEKKIIDADTYDKALIEADNIIWEFLDGDDRYGRTVEDIMEEEGCSEDDAMYIYSEKRDDFITSELTEYEEEM